MDEAQIYKRKMVKEKITSRYLDEARECKVFLPPGYSEQSVYPVIYCQDGDDFFNLGRIATHATRLILEEAIVPVVIVGVNVNRAQRTAEYSPDGERFGVYTLFFTNELVPYIEERYAIQASKLGRILAGDSLGGTVSLHLALNAPDLFAKIISLSGAFLARTQEEIAARGDLSHLNMYMLIGTEESAVSTDRGIYDFLTHNQIAHGLLTERGAHITYREKTGGHTWGFWQNELPEALQLFLGRANGHTVL